MADRDGYLKVVGTGGTLRENSTSNAAMVHAVHSLRGIVVDLAEKIGADERVGAVA